MIEKGQWWEFGQDTRVTPLLFKRSAMGFLITTESQHLGLSSHPKVAYICLCFTSHLESHTILIKKKYVKHFYIRLRNIL